MADLYFKVNADYEELIRMQQEAARLKDELSDFSGTKKEFADLSNQLADVQDKILKISDEAAQNFKEAFSEMDADKPEFLDDFTEQAQKFSDNMSNYFAGVQSDYEDMLRQLDNGTAKLELVSADDGQVQDAKEQIQQLKEEIQENIELCKLQREVWDGLYDSTIPQDAEAVVDSMRADMEEYLQTLKESSEDGKSFASSSQIITEALGDQSEALKRLNLEDVKNNYREAAQRLEELAQRMVKAQQDYVNAAAEVSGLRSAAERGDESVTKSDLQDAVDKMNFQKSLLADIAKEYDEVNTHVREYRQQLDDASEHHVRMRTQIMNAREEMMQMIAAGQAGTPAFQQLAQEAGAMRRQMNLANATMQYFANPQRHLAALKTGLQGVAGAAGLVNGVMGIFNTNSEKMAQIQTKVQSIMAVVVGLETTYNAIKKTSTIMLAIQEVKTWALAAARKAETVATEEAAVAQTELNVAMDANPIGAIIVVVMAAAAAIYALVSGIKSLIDANSESAQAAEFAKKEYEHQREQIEEINKSASKTAGDMISKYKTLKEEWSKLRSEFEQKKFIKDHENDFHDLGSAIDDVSAATQYFSDDGTKAFNNACIARAKAMAYAAAAAAEFQRAIEAKMNMDNIQNILSASKNASQLAEKARENGIDPDEFQAWYRTYAGERKVLEDKQKQYDRIYNVANERGKKLIEQQEAETKSYEEWIAKAGGRKYEGGGGSTPKRTSKTGKTGSSVTYTDKRAEEVTEAEKIRKENYDRLRKLDQDALKAEQDTDKKRALQRKLDLQDTREYYRALEMQKIADEKAKYDEAHKNDKNRTSYYDSEQYKSHFLEEKDQFNKDMNAINLKAYENEIQFYTNLREVQQKMDESNEFNKTLKSLEQFFDERVKIEKKYLEQREQIRKAQEKGVIDDETAEQLTSKLNKQQQVALDKVAYEKYKNSPILAAAMANSRTSYDELNKFREEFNSMLEGALENATVTDFKGILDSYAKLTDEMVNKNPFGEMKAAAEDLHTAQQELEDEIGELSGLYERFGVDSKGNIVDVNGEMAKLKQAATEAEDNLEAAISMREIAEQNLSDANEQFTTARAEAATEEELAALVRAQENAAEAVKKAIEEEDAAKKDAAVASQQYANALNQVTQQEERVRKANMKVQTQQKRSDKATKASITTIKQWASAIKDAASMFQSPVASAVSGMMDLTSTTLDSIEAMKQSGYGAAKGVAKVAAAVQNAVAILAIIQAAWQVINTIMSLFSGKDEENYKKRIDGLKAQVDALDYAFNNLKEDMDEAWGTEAIDAYIKAVETLNDRQKAQLELIKEQSKAHIGHHSLEHYMKNEAGITDKELAAAKKRIEELGGDTSTGWITDWIYTLTADQLKQFLTEGIGVTITGKLGGVSGTGDYSGSDWLNDLQEFANSAQTAEDIADEMAAKLNGISLDGLKDEIKSLVTTFDTSFNDINNSFDGFMREAAYNKARTKYDKDLEQFYNDLKDINNLYTEGEISEEEYRKRIAEMRERYKSLVKGAQDDYQQSLTDAGVNVRDIEQGATTGGFEALSEDTGTELNGRFAAMQAQETITAENTGQLLVVTGAIHDIANELRDVQVNSYLELREISENTKKVVEPILTMQEDIKRIKENTESL